LNHPALSIRPALCDASRAI